MIIPPRWVWVTSLVLIAAAVISAGVIAWTLLILAERQAVTDRAVCAIEIHIRSNQRLIAAGLHVRLPPQGQTPGC